MRKFGIIGYPLGHSFSMEFFNQKFRNQALDCLYRNIELPDLDGFTSKIADLDGFNITIPYKREVIRFMDSLSPEAEVIGAVNCAVRNSVDGSFIGYNTDAYGFRVALISMLCDLRPRALVLGASGGAAAAVRYVLDELSIEYIGVTRCGVDGTLKYDQLSKDIMINHALIINCTPLGTYPNIESCPSIPYQYITSSHYMFDLVYNPAETKFLRLGRLSGATVKNGSQMLYEQAEQAWKIWNK